MPVLIFFLVFIFTFWSNPSLSPKLSPDSYGYWSVAENFGIQNMDAAIRPWIFPLFIKFCMLISQDNWQITLSLLQIIFHSLITTLLFSLFKNYKLSNKISFIFSLIIGLNPNLQVYTTYVLADLMLAIFTTLSWFFILKINDDVGWNYNLIFFASLSCAFCILTKLVGLYMIVPLLTSILLVKGYSPRYLKISIIMCIINYSIYFCWKGYQYYQNPNPKLTKTSIVTGGINWTAIKSGYVDYGIGSLLHNRLIDNGKIDKARSLKLNYTYTMDESPEFVDVFMSVRGDMVVANDQEFAKKVLQAMPIKILFLSMAKWHSFFTKRCFFPNQNSFPGMPNMMRDLYTKFYSYLYRPFLLIFLIFAAIFLYRNNYKNLLFTSFGLLLYASVVVAIGSGHSGEFIRYRVWVEYIMWFIALIPIGMIIETMLVRFNLYKKANY
ncbi:MAG: hypothetical protein CBE24_04715 [bacterium TMED264]|nr:MAG: hypothetical protein CBE24_04715 [bacterium TMED264]|tara:strand:+ start:693 stop:2009 length:1317 start_codon:yes stop_codon:yes gene_type:complete